MNGTLTTILELSGSLSGQGSLSAVLANTADLSGSISATYYPNSYVGSYTWTPSPHEQTIEIADKTATQNITIEAIPSDWGHIGWDGSILTVS